jgi:hypothetical protein
MIHRFRICTLAAVALLFGLGARAATIDFEGLPTGLQDTFLSSDGNTLTITVDAPPGAPGALTPAVADVGGVTTAFVPNDTPFGGVGGTRFLTDALSGLTVAFDYFISFDRPVSSLSLNVYDFRRDSLAGIGDSVTLTVFSDAFTTFAGSNSFIIPAAFLPDGNVLTLAVPLPSALIRSAAITFSAPDVGTGIDDITFTTVPEPWTAFLLGAGLLGMGVLRRRQTVTR